MTKNEVIKIANCSGFYGDKLSAAKDMVDGAPKAIHYTEGGPWFPEYRFCDYHEIWKEKLQEMMASPN